MQLFSCSQVLWYFPIWKERILPPKSPSGSVGGSLLPFEQSKENDFKEYWKTPGDFSGQTMKMYLPVNHWLLCIHAWSVLYQGAYARKYKIFSSHQAPAGLSWPAEGGITTDTSIHREVRKRANGHIDLGSVQLLLFFLMYWDRVSCSRGWPSCSWGRPLSFWFSCLYLLCAGISRYFHHSWFLCGNKDGALGYIRLSYKPL